MSFGIQRDGWCVWNNENAAFILVHLWDVLIGAYFMTSHEMLRLWRSQIKAAAWCIRSVQLQNMRDPWLDFKCLHTSPKISCIILIWEFFVYQSREEDLKDIEIIKPKPGEMSWTHNGKLEMLDPKSISGLVCTKLDLMEKSLDCTRSLLQSSFLAMIHQK